MTLGRATCFSSVNSARRLSAPLTVRGTLLISDPYI
jgi:hypothetical protein